LTLQNHLMQVLTLVAMEAPVKVAGDGYSNCVRDAKVNVLKSMSPISVNDVVVGQYVANDKGDEGYLDDPTVPRGSHTPTFAQAHLKIHTPRWDGVPFIMKAGELWNSLLSLCPWYGVMLYVLFCREGTGRA
jgi:glucose-6-phosphate 1-dehydrogenase